MKLIANHPEEVFEIANEFNNKKKTLKDLNKIIEKLSLNISEDKINTFKGDVFEIFAWMFFKSFENDPSVGLTDYEAINIENDFGVDGKGINANGTKVAVQVKYRSNPKNLISYGDIAKTYTSGRLQLNLNLKRKDSIYVFTNAIDITPPCKEVFGNTIKVLHGKAIDHYIHNNRSFWKFFYKKVYEYLN